ncbi:MAG: TIGR00282 family metallophosphoesterase [candidate division Zixibacteria bacterium]|nr:TIGR00282 family metallophosphoesterase [candidate division Zixibacteria bacterium]
MKILFIGDIMGNPGLKAVANTLDVFKAQGKKFDFIIANVENSAGGFGINKDSWEKLSELDIDCMTSGNHIWDRPDINKYINDEPKLLRPANYPIGNPGFGWQVYNVADGLEIAVINLQGRVYMNNIDCPFLTADKILDEINGRFDNIFVDFHADASSEKQAMGWYLDGRVSAVVGTHTHIQTAETRILPGGTGFIADTGMCGSYDSVIGMEIEAALFRLLKGRPNRLKVATENLKFAGVQIEIDEQTGKCKYIESMLLDA